jgi:hypothetical protein
MNNSLRSPAISLRSLAIVTIVAFAFAGCAPSPEAELDAALDQTVRTLELRRERIGDANDIKRLQRAYGYYVDEGMWDEVADLFAENGSVEYGLDGVYMGREHIREYLYALGGGTSGLSEGQLNEHLQLMPVITVERDGMTAKGRWRGLILGGQLGESAMWGEGPYENEYVKEDGVWKVSKLHWYQSVVVPYETGWQNTEDPTGGVLVSSTLPADAPPTVEYETWPGTYLPPFHFPNPVLGAAPAPPPVEGDEDPAPEGSIAERAAILAQEIGILEDENAIENLQRSYGFYTDKQLWSEAADLFDDDGTIEIGGSGVYVGKDRIREYLATNGPEGPDGPDGPDDGRLFDQMQLQPIVHVAPDRQSAWARWHMFAQEAVSGEYAHWGVGTYENEYVQDNGVWKIRSLHQYTTMYAPYEDGWGVTALPLNEPSTERPPDRPPTVEYDAYPAVFVAPFHYENPVTGDGVYTDSPAVYATADESAASPDALADLDRRLTRLEDMDALERLNAIYGYYLARNQWDDLAGIFSPNGGTIEIAMRGVYIGPESVRRNLNLYGEQGIHHGLLHNHMQYQPVFHLSEDGLSAKMRSRAFSIMGQFGAYAQWMGGVYENEFVKEDGVWKILHDQVFNTYFVPYAIGWRDATFRPPPGINPQNPPDAPPTMAFDMYPRAFLPPFHYPNPVTGAEPPAWTPKTAVAN